VEIISEEVLHSMLQLQITANVILSTPILLTLMMEAIRFSITSVLKEPHYVTSQKTTFFIVTVVRTKILHKRILIKFNTGEAD
jgi:hypothetical protein